MARIVPSALIQSMSGKVCGHSDTYFVTNPQTGRVHTARVCNEPQQPNSEAQLAARSAFAQRAVLVKQWFAANKPSATNPNGTQAYIEARARFKAQHKVGMFTGYVSKHIAELTDTTPSQGSTPSDGTTNPGTGSGTLE